MTLYIVDMIVPERTPQDNPLEKTITIEEEVIVSVACFFPAGCRGRVYTAIYYGEEQIFPRPFGEYLHGDNETIAWQEYYELPESPCTLTIRAWSPTAQYSHAITWRINALPKNIAMWWGVIGKFVEALNSFLKLFKVR